MADRPGRRPLLSVVICTFDMPREAPRTIQSAAVPYQRRITPEDYEVIVVDNGSTRPLPESVTARLPRGVTLVAAPDPRPSPAAAMNWAARDVARGEILLLAVDGARIFSDGLCATVLAANEHVDDAFVYTLGWHLGPDVHMRSTANGYDEAEEDRLLRQAGWPDRPRSLFEISVLAGSSSRGFFRSIRESNAFSMRRGRFDQIGGFDERYQLPGGGLCNLEIFQRYVTRDDARNVCLLSEGTFHQIHGGIATSNRVSYEEMSAEHSTIFGRGLPPTVYDTLYFGAIRPEVVPFLQQSLTDASGS